MSLVAHEVGGTTYYACGECGACPCPTHNSDHVQECSHRVPDEWYAEDCAVMGPGRFVVCSSCRRPPCHRLT